GAWWPERPAGTILSVGREMAVRPEQATPGAAESLQALADAGSGVGSAPTLAAAMETLTGALARAAGAEAVVARVGDPSGKQMRACAVASTSAAVAAELEGSHFAVADLPEEEQTDLEAMPEAVRRAARRVRATAVVQLPLVTDGHALGSLELMRAGVPFDES